MVIKGRTNIEYTGFQEKVEMEDNICLTLVNAWLSWLENLVSVIGLNNLCVLKKIIRLLF